jgi:hypothetical protein
MQRSEQVAGTVWLSGALWLGLHYFVHTRGEFGPAPNPLGLWWLKLQRAGAVLFGAALFLTGSCYLLYYAGGEDMRAVAPVAHRVVGLAGRLRLAPVPAARAVVR